MKILHLEDNALDAELTRQTFLDEWPDCEVTLVETRSAFIAEFPSAPDLIVSDFNLVNFTGLEALNLARQQLPEVPFIFLSGTIGEDRAIEALRGGANDYVIKDRPKRLIPAARRALEDVKLRRQRQETDEQMRRVQRLENIGMLAAGIAHDFNNILAPVLMGIPLLRTALTSESDERILASIERSAERGAGLVRQILGFGRGVTGEPQLIQPKHLIYEIIEVMARTFPKSIRIESNISSDLWPMKVNPTQLHQVLLNLCVNARDAMPQGGTLRIRASNKPLDQMSASAMAGVQPGPYLLFEVSDTGTGIPPEVVAKMWDPFFTTKEVGKGTGLGLATVKGIIGEHHGNITLQTHPGQGTTFQIILPAEPDNVSVVTDSASAVIPRGRGELILVVDDDANLREVAGATLVGHGYRVLAAADGTEGLALFAPRSLEIRLVLTDLDMPNLDGSAMTKVMRALNPAIRVLTVSGSSDVEEARRRISPNGAFLAKPFTAESLLRNVNDLLSHGSAIPWESD
jgi:two-component system cell cycle sensor histidine kinase/response regulator CckA